MTLKNTSEGIYGVIGAGSFGTAVSNLIAENHRVLLYARRPEHAEQMRKTGENHGQPLHPRITIVDDMAEVTRNCPLLFLTVPSANFREMMKDLSPLLQPDHLLIHGTKGFDVPYTDEELLDEKLILRREDIKTMSEVILEETVVIRVGCLAGPNLAREIAEGLPAGAVIASKYDEVINEGKKAIRSPRFQIYRNYDIIGVEMAGALKNIIAIAAGAAAGLNLGENALALLISKGMADMLRIGVALGADRSAFLGLAGIGDLIATCSSPLSRNFTVGNRLARGEKLDDIIRTMTEVAEGVKTVKIAKAFIDEYKVRAPVVHTVYRVLFGDMNVKQAVEYLMKYPFDIDVDFL